MAEPFVLLIRNYGTRRWFAARAGVPVALGLAPALQAAVAGGPIRISPD